MKNWKNCLLTKYEDDDDDDELALDEEPGIDDPTYGDD